MSDNTSTQEPVGREAARRYLDRQPVVFSAVVYAGIDLATTLASLEAEVATGVERLALAGIGLYLWFRARPDEG